MNRWNCHCGATNAPCDTPARMVYATGTGCVVCGHPVACHDDGGDV